MIENLLAVLAQAGDELRYWARAYGAEAVGMSRVLIQVDRCPSGFRPDPDGGWWVETHVTLGCRWIEAPG